MKRVTTVVVGAGQCGLNMSRELSRRSIEHVVLERGRIGESWWSGRWDSLRLLTPNWLNGVFGDMPADPDGYMSAAQFGRTLSRAAADISAPVKGETRVVSIRSLGDGYVVQTDQGSLACNSVVVATGACARPRLPAFAAELPTSIAQFTALTYKRPSQLPDDAVIVGARVAGAATGLLLARAVARILIIDQDATIGDTLSTHALMRPAVELLASWGVLDGLAAAGTPWVRQAQFNYGSERITVPIKHTASAAGLIAPRRGLLDRAILAAAVAAGADLALGTAVEDCVRTGDRIAGVVLRAPDGERREVFADLVIGADGRRSKVAELVGAQPQVISPHRTATLYGYFPCIPNEGYRWYFGDGCRPVSFRRTTASTASLPPAGP